ncbi:MAG: VCBS repeat-containing protein [Bryobacterales bacterium]|nr:VCBS repeat-containing protein [Bryobacterales bacterium]
MECISKWRNYSEVRVRFGPWILALCAIHVYAADPTAILDSHVRCILGGVKEGAWIPTGPVSTTGSFRAVYAGGVSIPVSVGGVESAGEACEGTRSATLTPVPPGNLPFVVFSGKWNPQPRPVEDLSKHKGRYARAFQRFLADQGLREQAEVGQTLRADLDGDGQPEIIAVLRHPGSYTAILVRRQSQGRVSTLIASLEKDGEDLSEQRIAMLADLNGDGRMEIIVHGEYKQGIFTAVYALDRESIRKVMSCACGG